MKQSAHYILILLLLFVSVTVDIPQTLVRTEDSKTQLADACLCHEFVLAREATFRPSVSRPRIKSDVVPPPLYHPKTSVRPVGVFIPKSNTSFMAFRDCVCIPLRL